MSLNRVMVFYWATVGWVVRYLKTALSPTPLNETTDITTSHLTNPAKDAGQVIGYSHSTRLPKNASQVAGYAWGYRVCLDSGLRRNDGPEFKRDTNQLQIAMKVVLVYSARPSERWMSGLSRTPGKRVWGNTPPR